MNSSHLVTPLGSHHHHHNHHSHQQQQQHNSRPNTQHDTAKMSATNHNTDNNNANSSNHNNAQTILERQLYNAGLSNAMARANAHHHTTTTTNVGAGFTQTQSNAASPTQTPTPSQQHKFAPARRLAARQTLRLAIPKQQGDSSHSNLLSNEGISQFRHSSPSQLPPAPILKRTTVTTTPQVFVGPLSHSHIPKSASPLESHTIPSVGNNGSSMTATASSGGSGKFLRVRNPSITLNSGDLCNQNDLFAFAKELSSPSVGDHSPIFADISSSLSPATSSGSPSNHLNRLFSLSPSTLRNYGNVSKALSFNMQPIVDYSMVTKVISF